MLTAAFVLLTVGVILVLPAILIVIGWMVCGFGRMVYGLIRGDEDMLTNALFIGILLMALGLGLWAIHHDMHTPPCVATQADPLPTPQ